MAGAPRTASVSIATATSSTVVQRSQRSSCGSARWSRISSTLGASRKRSGSVMRESVPMRAIQVNEFGGPEVLVLRDVDDPQAPEGFVVLDVSAAGINYADTHQAENSYLQAAEL